MVYGILLPLVCPLFFCIPTALTPPLLPTPSLPHPPPPPAIQWFGVDIGGTLVKCVYFEPLESEEKGEGGEGVAAMRSFVRANLKYGSTGIRDQRLEMAYQTIGGQTGTLHFIKFATSRMDGFFDMVTNNGLGKFPKIVCATGGGAFKFEDDFREVSAR